MRFLGVGTSVIAGLWGFSFYMTAAISMGAPLARHPTTFLIPDGYVGWIEVKYGEVNASVLRVVNGALICKLPEEGIIETSSLLEQGWAKDEYFYYSQNGASYALRDTGWGLGGMIWAQSNEWQETPDHADHARVAEYFFVGTEEQYRHAVSSGEKRPFNQSTRTGVIR